MSRFLRLLALAILMTPGSAGCTLLGNFSTEQCTLPGDCDKLGGGPYQCLDNVCVADGPGATSGGGCNSNLQCTADNHGNPSVCNEGTCAQLLVGGACKLSYGKLSDENVIYGVLAPLYDNGIGKSPAADVTHLAIDEITAVGGIPIPGTNPERYITPLAIVCDQAAPDLDADLKRLRDEVGVDAYLSEMSASELLSYKDGVWVNEFVLATRANEEKLLVDFDNGGLLWHAIGNLLEVEPLYYVAIQEAAAHTLLPNAEIRIALVVPGWGGGYAELAGSVFAMLRNYVPGAQFQTYTVAEETPEAAGAAVVSMGSWKPDVVVDLVGSLFVDEMMGRIEADGSFEGDTIYVASPGARYSEDMLLGAQPLALEDRFIGVEHNTDVALYQAMIAGMPTFVPSGRAHGYNILYDAIYMMTYAVFAAGVTNLTPEKLADGLTRIDGGPLLTVGTAGDSFAQGIQWLQVTADDAFQLSGTTGLLDWDVNNGSRRTHIIGTYCLRKEVDFSVSYDFGRRHYDLDKHQFVDAWGNMVEQDQGACLSP